METIGKRVKALRESKRLSQKKLADLCEVSQPSIANIERGRTKEVKGYVLAALARELTSTEGYILNGVDGQDGHESEMMWAELTAIWRTLSMADKQALTRTARGMHAADAEASQINPFPKADVPARSRSKAKSGQS